MEIEKVVNQIIQFLPHDLQIYTMRAPTSIRTNLETWRELVKLWPKNNFKGYDRIEHLSYAKVLRKNLHEFQTGINGTTDSDPKISWKNWFIFLMEHQEMLITSQITNVARLRFPLTVKHSV